MYVPVISDIRCPEKYHQVANYKIQTLLLNVRVLKKKYF